MKKIDWTGQTLIVAYAAGLAIFNLLTQPHMGAGIFKGPLFVILMLLGPWQLLSSFAMAFSSDKFVLSNRIHLIASAIFLSFLGYFIQMEVLFLTITFLLAGAYYTITSLRIFYKEPKQSSFLPRLGF